MATLPTFIQEKITARTAALSAHREGCEVCTRAEDWWLMCAIGQRLQRQIDTVQQHGDCRGDA